jgi:uncharacterized protein (DUF433 family)
MGKLLDRITINPAVLFGKPTIRNRRCPVAMILDLLSAGMTNAEISEDYPDLELEDIQVCWVFVVQLIGLPQWCSEEVWVSGAGAPDGSWSCA